MTIFIKLIMDKSSLSKEELENLGLAKIKNNIDKI